MDKGPLYSLHIEEIFKIKVRRLKTKREKENKRPRTDIGISDPPAKKKYINNK